MKTLTAFKLMIVAVAFTLALTMGGCATCQQHPTACAIGGAIVVGSLAASYGAGHSDHRAATRPAFCGSTGAACN